MALIITTAEVAAVLALSLNDADLERAQSVIEAVAQVDLSSPDPTSRFSAADLRLLRAAVQWEVAFLEAHPEALTVQSNISSASANGASVSFNNAVEDGYLAPLAARVLSGLSWVAGGLRASTIKPQPRSDYEVRPSVWQRIG